MGRCFPHYSAHLLDIEISDSEARRLPQFVLKKFSRALDEFRTCIDNNAGAIVKNGEQERVKHI
jgi:hypothetical protein